MSLPGLPSLPAAAAALFSDVVAVLTDGISNSAATTGSQWGIFLNGNPVVIADNVLSMEYKQDFRISNYVVEQGAFASYNKVQQPAEVRFKFSSGGDSANRSAMLNSIASVIGDTNLYDIVTPDASYLSFNFTHQDYRRTAREGAGLLSVDVGCEEVRSASLIVSSTGTATAGSTGASGGGTTPFDDRFSGINTPQSPSAAPVVNGGNVQPTTPTAGEVSIFNNAMPLP